MQEERLVRDTCRVCGKKGPEYWEIHENGEWYPRVDTPKDIKHGFCSAECWEAYLTNILGRYERRRTERDARNGGQLSRQGIPVLRSVVKDDDQDDEERNPGHRDGRESAKGFRKRQGGKRGRG